MKRIKKVSTVKVDPITGSVCDTLNVEDKTTNAPSLRLMNNMLSSPVNSIIAYDGDDVPEGYEEVDNPNEVVLYESNTFSATGTLSDSIDNYKRLKIYITSSDMHNSSVELLTSPKTASNLLVSSFWLGSCVGTLYYAKTARIYISSTKFTLDRNYSIDINLSNGTSNPVEYNAIIILKIVGYKR